MLRVLTKPKSFFISCGLRTKLMLALIPSVIFILLVTGYFSYRLSNHFITIALKRNVLMRNLAISHDLEILLNKSRNTLLQLAQTDITPEKLLNFLLTNKKNGGVDLCELSFISSEGKDHALNFIQGGEIHTLAASEIYSVKPSPLLFLEKLKNLEPGQVFPSQLFKIEYPFPIENNANNILSKTIIRFATPAMSTEGKKGYLFMSVDAKAFRNILSIHNSPQSPLWGYPRSNEVRFSFMFDLSGWILYQSEEVSDKNAELATYLARSGYTGTLGKPGLAPAFRPNSGHKFFWEMVMNVQNGTSGVVKLSDDFEHGGVPDYFLSYAPVKYSLSPDSPPYVYAGVAYLDRSQLFLSAGYKYLDVMFIIIMASTFIIIFIIYGVAHFISKPINRLSRAVMDMQHDQVLKKLDMPESGLEIDQLRNALNNMMDKVATQLEEIREKDLTIYNVNMKEKANLEQDRAFLTQALESDELPDIVGIGQRMEEYKLSLIKASQVDVDVLIVGETGTGKTIGRPKLST